MPRPLDAQLVSVLDALEQEALGELSDMPFALADVHTRGGVRTVSLLYGAGRVAERRLLGAWVNYGDSWSATKLADIWIREGSGHDRARGDRAAYAAGVRWCVSYRRDYFKQWVLHLSTSIGGR